MHKHPNSRNNKRNSNQSRQHNKPRSPQNPGMRRPPVRRTSEAEQTFYAGIPVDPSPRIRLEDGNNDMTMRAMDLICPIGRGQRGLIVAPPGSGKTTFLKHICQSVTKAHKDIKLHCLLVDERPEEVTDFRRSVEADVRWSSMDESYEHHIEVANTLMAEVYKEVAAGEHVMIVIDSLTRLARVHNTQGRSTGRTLSGGMDAGAMEVPRRIFGAARNIENAGSLTILATCLVDTGSRMDQVVFEEFKGTGNMEIVLSRDLAGRRIFPAIDISQSGTRKSELLMDEQELTWVNKIRNVLGAMNPADSVTKLLDQLKKYPTNKELLASLSGRVEE